MAETLRLFYCRSHVIGSPIIRFLTWSAWSHCGVVTPNGTVIDARFGHGVTERPLQELLDYASKIEFRDLPVQDAAAGLAWLRTQLGKPYDWTWAIGIWWHRDWAEDDAWGCSELAERTMAAAGRCRFVNDPTRVTPQHSYMVA